MDVTQAIETASNKPLTQLRHALKKWETKAKRAARQYQTEEEETKLLYNTISKTPLVPLLLLDSLHPEAIHSGKGAWEYEHNTVSRALDFST